jgi:hypothetical protein
MMYKDEKMENITDLYLQGLSARQIAEITGISKSTVGARVKELGISRDRSTSQIWGCKRTTQVPFEWTFFPLAAQKAWLLGLIYGDGSLSDDGRRITITSGDRDVIDNVNHQFGGNLGIISSASTYWNIDIHSTRLWKELNSTFALVPHKSRVLRYPELSEAMNPHFIRGLLDSDGCWRSDIRNRQPKLIFQYVSLSLDSVQSLRVALVKFVGVSPRRNVSQGRGYSLTYSNQDAVKIGYWLYADSTPQVRCERKFTYWSQFT